MDSDRKRVITFIILAVSLFLLSACGKAGDSDLSDAAAPAPEADHSYLPQYTELGGGEFISFQDICFSGDCLYYNQVFFDVVNQKNIPILKQYSLTEDKVLRERNMISELEDGSRRQILEYDVLGDGSMYTVESVYSGSFRMTFLCSYDPGWNLGWEQDITAVMDGAGQQGQIDRITSDAEGRIYLVSGESICLLDAEGTYQGTVALGNARVCGAGTGRDGKAYICYREQQSMDQPEYRLAEVDFEEKELGVVYRNFPGEGAFAAGRENDFLVSGPDGLYGYDLAAQSAEELLEWAGCGMNGNDVEAVSAGRDGGLMAFCQDFSLQESSLVRLKRVETATLPEKVQVVIGCLGDSYELQSSVAAFNRQSDSCYVSVVNYARKEDGTEIEPQDAVDALSLALSTGIDCPDILALDHMAAYQMDIGAIAENGAFADLAPFLEKSSLLEREDYLENALECYRYQGQLVGIPCEIVLRTIVGKVSELGQEPGWTLEEMTAYAAAHPDQRLFNGALREDILYDCLAFNLEGFIDRETGLCRFDSEDFRELLAFAAAFPAEYDLSGDERTTQKMIQEGDVLLYETAVNDFYGIQEHPVMFGEPVAYIGYPAADGIGCIAECSGALALSARSKEQEAAWGFVEFYLENSVDNRWRSGFSTRKSFLEQQMKEAVTVSYYLDEEGNPLLDADGNPVPQSLGGVRWSFEEDEITFRTATEEEVDCVRELIGFARPVPASDGRILDMVREEAEPYFQGQKSVEEVSDIIQSRMQIYLDERQ
ncbi:MAG: extracellular solute-binding protein [Eubacterium sp.]|nr:extracellular solute-binding protein [Eubacterium sp.]MCM1305084.1 extracellular solute-binding protein [Butyrivibrio sp.]MCM1343496.1 extracellular solute-binding protein [Muribaculaceae bacterium]MCM1412440.1 extracellular solute-binding protein [Lachnospiraceae bacterium]